MLNQLIEVANCDIDNNVYWDNPIKSLGLIVELGDRLQNTCRNK